MRQGSFSGSQTHAFLVQPTLPLPLQVHVLHSSDAGKVSPGF